MSKGNFRRVYPNQESIILDHGLNNKYEPALIMDSESPDCLNVKFTNRAVGTRDGAVKLNTAPVFSGYAFDGFYTRRANNLAETLCAFTAGTMWTLNATTFVTVPSAQSVFTIGQRVGCEMAENYLFIGNGGAGPYKWDGTYFTLHGVVAPTQTMTATSGTTGSLTTNGVYMYRYHYVNTNLVSGNASPITTFTVSGVGLSVVLANIASGATASLGVNSRTIYRTQANGSQFFKLATLNDVSTTTYTDTTPDTALGAAEQTDLGTPPQYNAAIYHRGLLFVNDVNNPNYVWYSSVFSPYTFPSTNFFRVGDNTSDLVKGFAAFDNYIVVFCESSTWINYMPDPVTPSGWRQIRTISPYGSKSPYCLLNVNNTILHPVLENKKFVGFARLQGNTLDPTISLLTVTSAGSTRTSDKIDPDMFNVQEGYLSNISGIIYKNQAYITLTYGTGQTANNRVYLYDFSMEGLTQDHMVAWCPWTGLNIQQFAIYGGKLYGCSSSTNGYVYQLGDTGVYSDDGAAINSYIWTKELSGFPQDTNVEKDFRWVNALIDMAGAYYMGMRYRTDSDKGSGTSIQINVNPGGSLWGSMVFGRDVWGGGSNQSEPRIYLGASLRGKRLQIQFNNQNTAGQRFTVHRLQIAYNIKGNR